MKILFIGDISGEDGKRAVATNVSHLVNKHQIDFVIANAENTSKGRGLDKKDYLYLKHQGINFMTMGNHTWYHTLDIYDILKNDDIIRPLNLKQNQEIANHGKGSTLVAIKNKKIRITNLIGSSVHFHDKQTNPFLAFDEILKTFNDSDIHIVDFHCETTSEANAFFQHYKGKVSAILGTHTHVATNDYKIRDNTAYITDVGMTGNQDGVIGAEPEEIIDVFRNKKQRFKLKTKQGNWQFNAVLLNFDEATNQPILIKPIIIYERN